MGLASERKLGYLYSASEDGKFKITDLASKAVVTELQPGASLKYLSYDRKTGRITLADAEG